MGLLYKRVDELREYPDKRENLLGLLHDEIFQWTETFPQGGADVDISQKLLTIYNDTMGESDKSANSEFDWDQYIDDDDDDEDDE